MSEVFTLKSELKVHSGWITSIATSPKSPNTFVSGSRDNSVLIWEITDEKRLGYQEDFALPVRSLLGHSHIVQDVQFSSDGEYLISASWDKTMRLWDLREGVSSGVFVGHENDVLSVTFSQDGRHIISGSRDRTVKLWNTLNVCRHTFNDEHKDFISSVRFSPKQNATTFISGSWDKTVRLWDLAEPEKSKPLYGHKEYVKCTEMSPDGSLFSSGGRDGLVITWDPEKAAPLFALDNESPVEAISFSPNRLWLAVACQKSVKIWDLDSKTLVAELEPSFAKKGKRFMKPMPVSISWSVDGNKLIVGYTDNIIRIWAIDEEEDIAISGDEGQGAIDKEKGWDEYED